MYYVNVEQIEARLKFLPSVSKALRELAASQSRGEPAPLLMHLAQERALLLAIEAVTDAGSLLIDGFMMRDASSYEDIVEILGGEGVLHPETTEGLKELIALRRPLVQEYIELPRQTLREDLERFASLLDEFPSQVRAFLEKELGMFT